jgi:hypothetical protein
MSQLDALAPKDPNDKVDYAINWRKYLTKVGDTIQSSTWPEITPSGVGHLIVLATTHDGMRGIVKLDGGIAGTRYRLTNRIVTTPGARQRDKTISITVKEL